jgi:pyruvate formate lyase activating enzyme
MKGVVFDIKRFAIHDGPGIRTTVFLKGCPLRCWWCHNPESQDIKSETDVKRVILDGIPFEKREQIGKLTSVDELMEIIEKEAVFYEESGGGVTFSGGEPMLQNEFLLDVLKALSEKGIHTAVDTCGLAKKESFESILKYTDLFLFDLKHLDRKKHETYTGADNSIILKNLEFLVSKDAKIQIRIPVIGGINDSNGDMQAMLDYLKTFNGKIKDVHLLPYHSFAKNKYNRFQKENKLEGLKDFDKKDLVPIKKMFEADGFKVKIGG